MRLPPGFKQFLTALVVGLLVVIAGINLFAGQAIRSLVAKGQEASVLQQTRLVGALVGTAQRAGLRAEDQAALIHDALTRAGAGDMRFRLVTRAGKQLSATSFEADLARGAAPRPLQAAEKALYDLILSLPPGGQTRMWTDTARNQNWVTGAVPLMEDGARRGFVELALARTQTDTLGWIDPVFLILLGLVMTLALALAWHRPALGRWAAMGVVLAAAGFGAGAVESHQTERRAAIDQQVTLQVSSMAEAVGAIGRSRFDDFVAPDPKARRIDSRPDGSSDQTDQSDQSSLTNSITAIGLLGAGLAAFIVFGGASATGRALRENPTAYAYVAPALIGMLGLAFFPFFYGVILSFTDTTLLNQGSSWAERWVGFTNYLSILNDFTFKLDGGALNYQNFYWTLFVTLLWTVSNVTLGVSIGLGMALLLNIKGLRGVAIYRTLLILPWAIPNYITALTWKGMFHPQFGAINQAIQAFGGQPVQWFDSFGPAFVTGLATNAWLSFPFMMVVALGALQAVDEDMYEAARIDGASPWQQFWHITLPSLRPAMLPAVIVSIVWTFNMFNVIYLVSAGQPSGSNEILVTRAYKIAFEEYRYGYAAAYSVVIFLILLIYGVFQIKATAATEANNK